MTAQATLLTFDSGEQALDTPPQAPPRDPFSAETHEEFRELWKAKHGRYPSGHQWRLWWEDHPEEFEKRHGEPWKKAKARADRATREAEKHEAKMRKRQAETKEATG